MTLTVIIDERAISINIPEVYLTDGQSFFEKMDKDMDKGWQMSREWIDQPNTLNRCQIAADKLVDAMHAENENLVYLMSAYIISKIPNVTAIRINTEGDMLETEIETGG
jgi:hypothetical protein